MIVRDVFNTRPPELLASWLDALGTFDQLTPHDAAERWGVPVREAMERLHAMVGGPLEIPHGRIEAYRRVDWTPSAERPRLSNYDPHALQRQRVAMVPDGGISIATAAEMWGITPHSAAKLMQKLVVAGLLRRKRIDNRTHIFYRV